MFHALSTALIAIAALTSVYTPQSALNQDFFTGTGVAPSVVYDLGSGAAYGYNSAGEVQVAFYNTGTPADECVISDAPGHDLTATVFSRDAAIEKVTGTYGEFQLMAREMGAQDC